MPRARRPRPSVSMSPGPREIRAESGANIDLSISDLGSMTGLTAIAAYGRAMADIDRESDNSYGKNHDLLGLQSARKVREERTAWRNRSSGREPFRSGN